MATIADDRDLIKKFDCDKNINTMTQKIDNLSKNLNDFKIEIIEKIAELPDRLDRRYASKLTERIVFAMSGLILTSVFLAIIYLVIK